MSNRFYFQFCFLNSRCIALHLLVGLLFVVFEKCVSIFRLGCLVYLAFVLQTFDTLRLYSVFGFQCTMLLTVLSVIRNNNSMLFSLITGKTSCLYKSFRFVFILIRQPPALPCRLQHSTIGRLSLNLRVRDENGCVP